MGGLVAATHAIAWLVVAVCVTQLIAMEITEITPAALREASKKLFIDKEELSSEDVLEMLAIIKASGLESKLPTKISEDDLLEIYDIREERCEDKDFIEKLHNAYRVTMEHHIALRKYVKESYVRQIKLCHYEEIAFNSTAEYVQNNQPDWDLIDAFCEAVRDNYETNWEEQPDVDEIKMDQLLDNYLRTRHAESDYTEIYPIVGKLKNACTNFLGSCKDNVRSRLTGTCVPEQLFAK